MLDADPVAMAAPWPFACLVDEFRSHRASLDVATGRDKAAVFYRQRIESSLINRSMSYAVMTSMVGLGMGIEQASKEFRQIHCGIYDKHHMPMVGHQAVSCKRKVSPLKRDTLDAKIFRSHGRPEKSYVGLLRD